jgi:hypothetical protein
MITVAKRSRLPSPSVHRDIPQYTAYMRSSADAALQMLRQEWESWDIWVVYRYIGGPVFCARPKGTDDARLGVNAESPAALSALLASRR